MWALVISSGGGWWSSTHSRVGTPAKVTQPSVSIASQPRLGGGTCLSVCPKAAAKLARSVWYTIPVAHSGVGYQAPTFCTSVLAALSATHESQACRKGK